MSTDLHPSIVALVSLAASIASNHPKQGLCQVGRLQDYGVPRMQIDLVIEIARHIRDEAAQQLDARFDEAHAARFERGAAMRPSAITAAAGGACCAPTPSGTSCC